MGLLKRLNAWTETTAREEEGSQSSLRDSTQALKRSLRSVRGQPRPDSLKKGKCVGLTGGGWMLAHKMPADATLRRGTRQPMTNADKPRRIIHGFLIPNALAMKYKRRRKFYA